MPLRKNLLLLLFWLFDCTHFLATIFFLHKNIFHIRNNIALNCFHLFYLFCTTCLAFMKQKKPNVLTQDEWYLGEHTDAALGLR